MNIWAKRLVYFCDGVRSTLRGESSAAYPLCLIAHFLSRAFLGRETDIAVRNNVRFVTKKFRKSDCWDFNGVKLPLMSDDYETILAGIVYFESISPYLYEGTAFTKKFHGSGNRVYYGFIDKRINVSVEPGDIVIDAGSWVGDFAAVASKIGAHVYAFEPGAETFAYLCKTAELNKNVVPINMGLSDTAGNISMYIDDDNSAGSTFIQSGLLPKVDRSIDVPVTTLDDFVEQNGITKVDFIKSDIEGFERYMLKGAAKVLRKFAPKLAICTYHLPDDPEVLEKIILEANPDYRIVHMPQILFADAR